MNQFKNMLLVKGTISHEGNKKATFKMIPITSDCPYMEAMYHPIYRGFGIVGKFKKSSYEMVPALSKEGELVPKKKKVRSGEFPFMQERRLVEAWNEYEILTKEEILSFIKMFAVNSDSFDVEPFLKEPEPAVIIPEVKSEPVKPAELKATVTKEKAEV